MRNKEERKRKNAKWNKEEAEMRRQDVKEAKREYMRKKKKKREREQSGEGKKKKMKPKERELRLQRSNHLIKLPPCLHTII